MRNAMNTRIRPSAMGGFVMSPFGDFGDVDVGGIITSLANVTGKVVDALGRSGATATPYIPPTVNPYGQQQGWGAPPPQIGEDNTMLYVIGGAALLMVGGLILSRSR